MSSSKLLEQAIVDAQTLRDVAFKSAQATLLEKYAPQRHRRFPFISTQHQS